MTETEIKLLLKEACRVFPSIQAYMLEYPNIAIVWAEILEGDQFNSAITLDEAMDVLKRWKMGTLENPPIGFRRELFATDMRAVISLDRTKANSAWLKAKERSENQEKYERKKNGQPAFRLCAPLFDRILELNKQVINGTLSAHDKEWKVHDIVNELDEVESQ
jgi:hypothetical protein